jgi:very-short-patch-repair endonuclease
MADPWKTLARRSELHHGVFSRSEALSCGLTDNQLEWGVKTGRFERLYHNVYVHAGAPKSLQMHEAAACKSAGENAAISHRSALQEYGLADVRAEMIEVTTADRRCKCAPFKLHRTNYLPPHHIRMRNGRPVTDPARSCFDAGAVLRLPTVRRVVGQAVRRNLTTPKELMGRLIEHGGRGRPGCASLRTSLEDLHPDLGKVDSELEALMLHNVWSGSLPRPKVQYVVMVRGRKRRLDFAYPEVKLGIEAEGREEHGADHAFDPDRARNDELKTIGWEIVQFTWKHVHDDPEWVVGIIAETYRSRYQLFFGTLPS